MFYFVSFKPAPNLPKLFINKFFKYKKLTEMQQNMNCRELVVKAVQGVPLRNLTKLPKSTNKNWKGLSVNLFT